MGGYQPTGDPERDAIMKKLEASGIKFAGANNMPIDQLRNLEKTMSGIKKDGGAGKKAKTKREARRKRTQIRRALTRRSNRRLEDDGGDHPRALRRKDELDRRLILSTVVRDYRSERARASPASPSSPPLPSPLRQRPYTTRPPFVFFAHVSVPSSRSRSSCCASC